MLICWCHYPRQERNGAGGLLLDVQELTHRKVDVVTEAGLHPALRDRILSEAHWL